ncbi:MAG: hypothetical protein GF368_01165 [Candidatus Aenigmarchaeota archaeon]|nr:hypothetical protein [Candidatus Aenigmarchaeota archaeon]
MGRRYHDLDRMEGRIAHVQVRGYAGVEVGGRQFTWRQLGIGSGLNRTGVSGILGIIELHENGNSDNPPYCTPTTF